ncbi:MAG: polysaccharide deacetylase family protein [Clostridiales bacterium]|nr:polysaccharide deacetylase family protein [Clostridiales bacterium]
MSSRKKFIFFLSMIMIVSLLLFLPKKQSPEMQMTEKQSPGMQMSQETSQTVTSQSIITKDYILVKKVVTEQSDKELQKIAITFDDGPHPHYTEQLLDGLKERGVHATFFVTGEHAELHPDIIKRMYDEGHLIGNHTYSHIQLTKNNREKFKAELVQTSEVIEEITGEEVIYVRPPYGTWDKKFEEELNMIPVLWTIDPLDWCSNNAASVVNKIVAKAEENDIILMHDYYDTSVTAALQAVDRLLQEGYEFVTVDEILFD